MATAAPPKPSFAPHRKWSIGFNVVLIVFIVFSVVGMVNYLSRDYFYRLHWSTRAKVELSPLTVKFLKSLTNQVRVVVYYDKDEPLYSTVLALLNEYRLSNPKITIQIVDYLRDPAAAQEVKKTYKLAAVTDRNLIIFDCEGKSQPVPGDVLAKYVNEQVPNEKQPLFRRKPTEFYGEKWFTSALLSVTSPRVLKAYALERHGEHPIDGNDATGYAQFAALLGQYLISTKSISLMGTNTIPEDCQLLIIAGPQKPVLAEELEKIDHYLSQGGRLFALFNAYTAKTDIGLEGVLAKYGIHVGHNIIVDPVNAQAASLGAVVVADFAPHPIVNPLMENAVALMQPRSISKLKSPPQAADALRVEEIAWSGTKAYSREDPAREPQKFPFIVAAEKAAPRGVITERGSCRIVVAGDSQFLNNNTIDSLANRDFAINAANWLLNRTQLLEELGPRNIIHWKIIMTRSQLQRTQWLLLAVMPGAALMLGILVWLRRRR